MPSLLPMTAIPCRLLRFNALAGNRELPTGVLHQLFDAAHLTQVDLDRWDREIHVTHRERQLRLLVGSPRLFDGEIIVDRRRYVGLTVTPQVEEALALHPQLQSPLRADRGQGGRGIRECGIEPHL